MKAVDALSPAMNDTKWDELRLEMYALNPAPRWSTLSTNGYKSAPDGEWFHHFRTGGYEDILRVDIFAADSSQRELIRAALKRVHVPGEETLEGFSVFGYLEAGQFADFI